MKKERLDFLKKHIHKLDIDLKNGIIKNRKINNVHATGYLTTGLHYRFFYVHEIIAVAAGFDILNKTVDHLDGNKLNNSIHNLEPVSQSKNIKRAHANGLIKYNGGNRGATSKLSIEQRERMLEMYFSGKYTGTTLAERFGVTPGYIYQIIKKNR